MAGNGNLPRNQEKFLAGLLLGKSIVDAAKASGIAERTAHRYVKDEAFHAERTRRETALREAEEAEIKRILTTGYAAVHERVKALDAWAHVVEDSMIDPETKQVNPKWLNPDKLREWRGMLDDIAKETGGRVKKQKVDVTLLPKAYIDLDADEDGCEP